MVCIAGVSVGLLHVERNEIPSIKDFSAELCDSPPSARWCRAEMESGTNRTPSENTSQLQWSVSAFENECNLWPLKTSVHLCVQKSKTLQVSILKRKAVPQPHKYKLGQVTDICRLY